MNAAKVTKLYFGATSVSGFAFGFGSDMNTNHPRELLYPPVFLQACGQGLWAAVIMPFLPLLAALEAGSGGLNGGPE